jgi:hypothetical protein
MTAKAAGQNARRTKLPEAAPPNNMPPAQAGAWDRPWDRKEDAAGWETVYRGTGQRREVGISVVLDLTPEQNRWLRLATTQSGLSLHDFLAKVIEDARIAAEGDEPLMQAPPTKQSKP